MQPAWNTQPDQDHQAWGAQQTNQPNGRNTNAPGEDTDAARSWGAQETGQPNQSQGWNAQPTGEGTRQTEGWSTQEGAEQAGQSQGWAAEQNGVGAGEGSGGARNRPVGRTKAGARRTPASRLAKRRLGVPSRPMPTRARPGVRGRPAMMLPKASRGELSNTARVHQGQAWAAQQTGAQGNQTQGWGAQQSGSSAERGAGRPGARVGGSAGWGWLGAGWWLGA